MKGLFLSGGSTKFISLVSACYSLEKAGYHPDYICGTSAGSITAIMMATNNLDAATEIGLELRMEDMFSECPFTTNGGLSLAGYKNILLGRNYLGKMGSLEYLLKYYLNEQTYSAYIESNNLPDVYVIAVNAKTKRRKIWNLKSIRDRDLAVKVIMASSSIPLVCPPIEIEGEYYYDGGIRDHSPGPYMLERTGIKFDEIVSVYTRPEKYTVQESHTWSKNLITVFTDFLMPTMNIEISKNDEQIERYECEKRGIKYTPIFIEPFLTSLFDVNPDRLRNGYVNGVKAVDKYFK